MKNKIYVIILYLIVMKYILVKSLIKCYFLCKIEYFHSPIYRFILTYIYVCMYVCIDIGTILSEYLLHIHVLENNSFAYMWNFISK